MINTLGKTTSNYFLNFSSHCSEMNEILAKDSLHYLF